MTAADTELVTGERGQPVVARSLSLHSRLGNLLALGLMLLMGAATLTMYYLHAARRQAEGHAKTQASSSGQAKAEMVLPALDAILAPITAAPRSGEPAPASQALPAAPLAASGPTALPLATGAASAPVRPTSLERRLSGAAFTPVDPGRGSSTAPVIGDQSSQPHAESGAPASATVLPAAAGGPSTGTSGVSPSADSSAAMTGLLRTQPAFAVAAHVLSSQRLLLPKGAFIDCTLETAIDSTLPGMTACLTATDTFSADGQVVLLERGTKLIGETRGQVQQGSARVFVVWIEARTPTGVIVPLDSPGADQLGRSGLSGTVDRHFWQRFGAALLVSTIDGAVQAAVQASTRSGSAVIYNPSAAQDVGTEVLKSTLGIPPTVRIRNGERIQILVARDVDFTEVYELRHAGPTH